MSATSFYDDCAPTSPAVRYAVNPNAPVPDRAASRFGGAQNARFVFSVDLEDYFHVSAFESIAPRARWDQFTSRVDYSTNVLLDLLDDTHSRATFFVLGWVAERQPKLIQAVAARGHEIAAHSYWHQRVTTMTRADFTADAIRTRELLEQILGADVSGFRAPSFSITPSNAWAFEALVEAGYRYDSSVFPIRRRGYGFPGAPRDAYTIQTASGALDEFPLATLSLGPWPLPAAGGGYLRHFPFQVIAASVREVKDAGRVGVYYIHPWEVDVDQPRLATSTLTRWRHYGGLRHTAPRLRRLLESAPFTSFRALREERAA